MSQQQVGLCAHRNVKTRSRKWWRERERDPHTGAMNHRAALPATYTLQSEQTTNQRKSDTSRSARCSAIQNHETLMPDFFIVRRREGLFSRSKQLLFDSVCD